MKVIMMCVNIKLWDKLGCFHYILNAPRTPNVHGFLYPFKYFEKVSHIPEQNWQINILPR